MKDHVAVQPSPSWPRRWRGCRRRPGTSSNLTRPASGP